MEENFQIQLAYDLLHSGKLKFKEIFQIQLANDQAWWEAGKGKVCITKKGVKKVPKCIA